MIRIRRGQVLELLAERPGATELTVELEGTRAKAINYDTMTGKINVGDKVILNTTAVHEGLGTGGYHFVIANLNNTGKDAGGKGHIMKLRYTPAQVKVYAAEEGGQDNSNLGETLEGTPVVVATLHSMLPPAAAVVKKAGGDSLRLVYLMTDGGALPLSFSRLVQELKGKGVIDKTVTAGHAFGGDYEAINIYSGLLAARGAGADVIIVSMGPGIVGTASRYGFTGVEQGEIVNAVNVLGGRPVAVPRISFADPRSRHRGVSHHTLTALGRVALSRALVPVPLMQEREMNFIRKQLKDAGISKKHEIVELDSSITLEALKDYDIKVTTMGRSVDEDRHYFLAAGAAGLLATQKALGKE